MDITIDQLLSGKNTKIKDKEFFATKAYVEPFLDRVSKVTDDFQVKVELPDQITMTEDADDITYNRVWLQAVLPDVHFPSMSVLFPSHRYPQAAL